MRKVWNDDFRIVLTSLYNRLIVIAEKDVVYNKFPIPLINRMEKHFLVMSSGLTAPQKQVSEKLQAWVEDFAEVFQQLHEKKRFVKMHITFTFALSIYRGGTVGDSVSLHLA